MDSSQQSLFTCISCSIAFLSAEEQRTHYRSDHHRYNMKRRVASLPPVSAAVFNEKVLERRAETAVMSSLNGSSCDVCSKTYSTENAYRSHLNSKRHKDNELRSVTKEAPSQNVPTKQDIPKPAPVSSPPKTLTVDDAASDDEINQTIDEKIAAARSRISQTQCLFCPEETDSLENNLTHMSSAHSFFIPDADYLVDLPGLIDYLGEKIAIGNVCIHCNGKGREFRTLEAIRKHMQDKAHCKIAYDTETERLEFSDYYDFTSSYSGVVGKKDDEEWEDAEGDDVEDADQVVEESESESDSTEDLPDNQLAYGDSHYELVLPSGARIGHRRMRRYYAQSFASLSKRKDEDPNSGKALVRQLLADKHSALVPRKGGFGAFGSGTDVVKARNRGEAREAGRHVREFRDQKRREDFKTKVGFIGNHQKHYRDPLLQ
ncbi:C2H2 type zinc-finger-domain-containing protein [Armillaria novae-zelandiae]|uniref:C2H2 type zinc-finger-domain-containing protein n=1 Tax=Armillaria novae-zelandiae TaxID=153914 RepID=A0AA39PM06_9AGAR|nr:C2H2 type zinc-finger-domain-containing protein [Armillaria novae-zelandiae]